MSIIRVSKRDNPFVQMDKTSLEDTRLSWKAKGLLAYLLSRPDNWQIKVRHLVKQSKDSFVSVQSGINELIENGYCVRSEHQMHDENGYLAGYDYTIYETPCIGFPCKDNPYKENQLTNNNDSNNKDLNKFEEDETLAKLCKLYENNLGMITPVSAEWLKDAAQEYPADWFEPSLKEMLKNNVRTWNYWESILKRWKRDGFMSDNRPKKTNGKKKRDYDKAADEWLAMRRKAEEAQG